MNVCFERSLDPRVVPRGLHACYIYDDDEERLELLARFLADGAAAGEKILYVTDGRDPSIVREELAAHGAVLPNPPGCEIHPARDAYLRKGRFEADSMFRLLRENYEDAIREGYPGCRVSGEMAWMLGDVDGKDQVLPYEARVTQVLARYTTEAICQYDARRFSGETIMDMLAIHPFLIVKGCVVENPYFTDPEAYLRRVSGRLPH